MTCRQCLSLVRASAQCYRKLFGRIGQEETFFGYALGGAWENIKEQCAARSRNATSMFCHFNESCYYETCLEKYILSSVKVGHDFGMSYLDICYTLCRKFHELGDRSKGSFGPVCLHNYCCGGGWRGNRRAQKKAGPIKPGPINGFYCHLPEEGVSVRRKLAFLRKEQAFWGTITDKNVPDLELGCLDPNQLALLSQMKSGDPK